jgi:hypothetical protein
MTTQSDQTDVLAARDQPGASSVPAAPDADLQASIHEARLSRLLDYQARSLSKPDPLEANLGSINSGLMRMAVWLDEAVAQALASGPPHVERLAHVSQAIETLLRVTRQVDRFTQIELRALEARRPRRTGPAREPLSLDGRR